MFKLLSFLSAAPSPSRWPLPVSIEREMKKLFSLQGLPHRSCMGLVTSSLLSAPCRLRGNARGNCAPPPWARSVPHRAMRK